MAGPWDKYQQPSGPWERYGGEQVKPSPPGYGNLQPKSDVELRQSKLNLQKTAGTLSAEETRARNEAAKSGIDLQAAQTDLNIKQGTPPGDPSKYGADYIATLPSGVRDLATAMLGGKYKGNVTNSRNPTVIQAAIAAQHATHGQFDAGKYDERLALMKSMTDPNSSLGALNTALAHAGVLYDQASDVAGTSALGHNPLSVGLNALANTWNSASPAVKTYEGTVGKYGPEQAKAYQIGTGGERQGIEEQYSVNLPLDTKQALLKNDAHLYSGKINSLAHGYDMLGANSPLDYLSPDAKVALQKVDPDTYKKLFGAPVPGTNETGNQPPGMPPSAPPPVAPPAGPGGQPPGAPPSADYSSMVGAPNTAAASGHTRTVTDPIVQAALAGFIRKGAPFETVAAYTQSHGFNPPDPKAYAAGVAFAREHHGATNVEADRVLPTTLGERLSSSAPAAAIAGFGAGSTAGLADVAGRAAAGPAWDANRQALSNAHGTADFLGNLAGGAAGAYFGPGLLGKIAPKAAESLGALAESRPVATAAGTGMAQGATYGASENPDAPLSGALMGGSLGGLAGTAGTLGARSLGSMIAPTGGNLKPLFDANPSFRPTVGQRLSASDSPFIRALGAGEQAAESIPITGGIQGAARGAATDQMQRGAFNHALGEIGQQLPDGITKGPEAHTFMQKALGQAQNDARSNMQFTADPQYASDFGAWQRSPSALSLTSDQTDHVNKVIGSALGGRVNGGSMAGPDYAAAQSDLGRVARQWASNPATSGQAAYLRDFQDIMDAAAGRASPPEASNALSAANRGYAKGVIIENAARSAGGEPTEFSGKQLLRSVQKGDDSVRDRAFLQGQGLMQDYATAANKLSPSLADSGTPQRLAWMNLAGGAEAGGLLGAVAYGGHPSVLAPWAIDTAANLPGVRKLVGAAMAPRDAVLPPSLAQPFNVAGRNLKDLAPYAGNAAVPGTLAWYANH